MIMGDSKREEHQPAARHGHRAQLDREALGDRADDLVGGCLACKIRWCEYHERCATNGCNPGAVKECDCDGGPVRVRPTK